MIREIYIEWRNNQPLLIMYEYYKEFFHLTKIRPMLDFQSFTSVLQVWQFAQEAYVYVCEYYDCKFNVTKVPLKDKIIYI